MSSPGTKQKRTMKICRECNKQVPTASKSCSCGFAFIAKRVSTEASSTDVVVEAPVVVASGSDDVHHRRTQRTRRGRPHFFDSLEYGPRFNKKRSLSSSGILSHSAGNGVKHKRGLQQHTPLIKIKSNVSPGKSKIMQGSTSSTSHLLNKSPTTSSSGSAGDPTTFGRNGSAKKDPTSNGSGGSNVNEDDVYNDLSAEKILQYSTVLAEINRKCTAVNFRPG